MLRRPRVRHALLGPLVALAALATCAPLAGAQPALVPGAPVPVEVTVGVAFETTVATFTDAVPGSVPSDGGFVALLYQDLLGRAVDGTYWADQLAAGSSRAQVADALVRSHEWRRRTAARWWQQALGRTPEDLDAWADALAGPWTVAHARAVLLSTPEHPARAAGDDAFLDELYRRALGRAVDEPARAWLRSVLAFGIPHLVVADYVLASPEAHRHRAGQLVTELLRRAPAADELDRYAASLATYGEAATVATIVATDDYDRLQPSTYSATISVDGGAARLARVVRRPDGSFAVVAPVVVGTAGSHSAVVTVTRTTGEQVAVTVPVTARRARNETYLDAVAAEAIGRPLTSAELADLVARIPAGGSRTRARVALDLLAGEEGRRRVVQALYRQLLGREALASEAAYWGDRIATDSVMVVRALLLGSDEAVLLGGGSDAGWVDLVYRRVLGRPADAAAVADWSAVLRTGLPRPIVAYVIVTSAEGTIGIAAWWSSEVLGRAPTAFESALGQFVVGITPYELGFPALLLGGDAFYTDRTGPGA